MSSKLNVTGIVRGHFKTLRNASTGSFAKIDIVVFVLMPVILAVVFAVYGYNLDQEVRSLLVNFGAIFTALLLSVLVLVYDQERKYADASGHDSLNQAKKNLLHELYYNISFSIICSVFLIIVSLLHSLVGDLAIELIVKSVHISGTIGSFILTPLVTFVTITIFLNVIMVVKRMHTLLTT